MRIVVWIVAKGTEEPYFKNELDSGWCRGLLSTDGDTKMTLI